MGNGVQHLAIWTTYDCGHSHTIPSGNSVLINVRKEEMCVHRHIDFNTFAASHLNTQGH